MTFYEEMREFFGRYGREMTVVRLMNEGFNRASAESMATELENVRQAGTTE